MVASSGQIRQESMTLISCGTCEYCISLIVARPPVTKRTLRFLFSPSLLPTTMKLKNALGIVFHIYGSVQIALWPTLLELSRKPSLLFSPRSSRRIFMAHLWKLLGDGIDGNESPNRIELITPNAQGVVLDLGAGPSTIDPCTSTMLEIDHHHRAWPPCQILGSQQSQQIRRDGA